LLILDVERTASSSSDSDAHEGLSNLLKGLSESGHLARLLEMARQLAARPGQAGGSLAGDILYGADGIAEFLYGDRKLRRKVYNLVEKACLPHFRLGAVICARRSVLLNWIQAQERALGVDQQATTVMP
jgi:hypothetical protein